MTYGNYGSPAAVMVTLILIVETLDFGGVLQRLLPTTVTVPALAITFVTGAIAMTIHLLLGYVTGWERRQFVLNSTLGILLILGVGHLTYSVALGV